MEIGYTKQILVSYLLYHSAYFLSAYGRYFHFCHARYEKYAHPIYDCNERFDGAFIGLPPSLIETYGSDINKVYKANGVPIYLGLITMFLSAFIHLMIACAVIVLLAPILFESVLPPQLPIFFFALALYIIVSLSIGNILGLMIKNQAKLTMIAQLVFLPSIMLSGIMFPIDLLPVFLEVIGHFFPASWGYRLMLDNGVCFENLWYLILVFFIAVIVCGILLKKQKSK